MKTVDVGPDFGGQCVISGLNMYSTYSVVVQAFNSRGSGPFSDPVTARTDEGGSHLSQLNEIIFLVNKYINQTLNLVPTAPPENIQCMALTSQSVQIAWSPPTPEGRNGLIQGYKVSYQPAEDWYGMYKQIH